MLRIGFAKDIHRLIKNRKLILGGIIIPFAKGEDAYSDGDVVFHALSEALLGALALGDLGSNFPNSDPKYHNINSEVILNETYKKIKRKKYIINNLDITICLETPRIANYVESIKKNIASILSLKLDQVSVKVNSNEKIDAIGKGDAVEASAVVLLTNEK